MNELTKALCKRYRSIKPTIVPSDNMSLRSRFENAI